MGKDAGNDRLRIICQIEDQLTQGFIDKLCAYAHFKAKNKYWQGIMGYPMPKGLEPEDVVSEALGKVLDGNRNWNPSKHPDLFEYLKSVIDSLVSHINHGAENRTFQTVTAYETITKKQGFMDCQETNSPPPDIEIINNEIEAESEKFFWDFHSYLDGETELQEYLECIFDDIFKPQEIATKMGKPIKEIRNMKKKLKRKLASFQATKKK